MFMLILFILLVITGVVKIFDRKVLQPRRIDQFGSNDKQFQPWWVEWCISFFPVILFVFVLRAFVVEPFRIPSGSMLPTLQDGDMIAVNKFSYGIRLPILHLKILPTWSPERGDVVVFRYPVNPEVDFIKRIVGLPGDVVSYQNKQLTINGKLVTQKEIAPYVNPAQQPGNPIQYQETLDKVSHDILRMPGIDMPLPSPNFPNASNCHVSGASFTCTVPAGHYFVMGDNRDNSDDSRYWGFVPDENLVGKAFFIWMNLHGHFGRIGSFN